MEIVFRNQLVPKNQSLRGNVFAYSFPRNGPYITIYIYTIKLTQAGLTLPMALLC
jgi:hypothetical protein